MAGTYSQIHCILHNDVSIFISQTIKSQNMIQDLSPSFGRKLMTQLNVCIHLQESTLSNQDQQVWSQDQQAARQDQRAWNRDRQVANSQVSLAAWQAWHCRCWHSSTSSLQGVNPRNRDWRVADRQVSKGCSIAAVAHKHIVSCVPL